MNSIFTRRSIRKYTNQEISEEIIEKIIRAGMAAPSAGNEQPWHFVVLNDRSLLDAIPKFHPHARMMAEARCAIVVCGDADLEVHKGYWVQDCSAATENMLLEAQELGLGSVWMGVYPVEDRVVGLRALLDMPATITPFSIVVIGYPAETREPANRFNPARIHRNKW